MARFSIADPEALGVSEGGQIYYGANQEWFGRQAQRYAGCAPCVASSLMRYITAKREERKTVSKEEMTQLMEEMWDYVTPGETGLPSVALFAESVMGYLKAKELFVARVAVCDLHTPKRERPSIAYVANFIESALSTDIPVAFLNLDSGGEKSLETWHWVVITAMERDGDRVEIEYIDEGEFRKADLSLWYKTTEGGGGFVFFKIL
jgi:hypothetical protein